MALYKNLVCIVLYAVALYAAINTGNDLPSRGDTSPISSSVIDEPPSDSGTGPGVPAPRTSQLSYLLSTSQLRVIG